MGHMQWLATQHTGNRVGQRLFQKAANLHHRAKHANQGRLVMAQAEIDTPSEDMPAELIEMARLARRLLIVEEATNAFVQD